MTQRTPIVQPLFLAVVLAVGFGLAWGLAATLCIAFVEEVRRAYRAGESRVHRSLEVLGDGTPVIESYTNHDKSTATYETLDGEPIVPPQPDAFLRAVGLPHPGGRRGRWGEQAWRRAITFVDTGAERLLPKMKKNATPHFDVYYAEGSTAEKEIQHIVSQRERAFQQICDFLGSESDVRVCLVFFENQGVKAAETGHQGAGWAFGNTIVEVYNEREKLDPYHELVHVLMRPHGSPPAALNEGFAVYMSERLGAPALAGLGGGQSSIYQRVRELKGSGQWIPLQELLTYTEIGSKASQPTVSYPEAASFVKFLIDRDGKGTFLKAYKTLKSPRDRTFQRENIRALEQIYNKRLGDLEKEWERTFSTDQAAPEPSSGSVEARSRPANLSHSSRTCLWRLADSRERPATSDDLDFRTNQTSGSQPGSYSRPHSALA